MLHNEVNSILLVLLLLIFSFEIGATFAATNLTGKTLVADDHSVDLLNDRLDLNQIFYSIALSSKCRDAVVGDERQCYIDHLDRFAALFQYRLNADFSSEYERKTCCAIWDYLDCVRPAVRRCSAADLDSFDAMPDDINNAYVVYCLGYEYGSHQCYVFSLAVIIILGFAITIFLILATACLIWYWRHGARNNIEYYRQRRRFRRP